LRKNLWRLVLKGAVGFLVGLAIWAGLSVPYTRLLASLSQTVVRLDERPPVTSIIPDGTLMVVDRRDLPPPPSGRLGVQSTDITFNLILLMTLFAASSRALSDRNVFGFAVAAVALVFVHVAAVVSFVKAYYALSLGAWSASHYGFVARHFWGAAPYFYSVVGVYGFAIALWWLFRPTQSARA
jgi:magnesium-transporting ATPase (P-type)